MTDDQVKNAVNLAIRCLKTEEPRLDFASVHKRSTAHRLAVHLEPRFPCWNVDCEYDRAGGLQKRLNGITECDSSRTTDRILPDIIVHHRREQGPGHNLLVVELKKGAEDDPCDKRNFELMTDPNEHFRYQLGLDVNIDGGLFTCTWYKDGVRLG